MKSINKTIKMNTMNTPEPVGTEEMIQQDQDIVYREAPKELFNQEEGEVDTEVRTKKVEYSKISPQEQFNNLVQLFYSSKPFMFNSAFTPELEVRFGTRSIKQITRNDYDNVIKKLKSLGFVTNNNIGEYYLRMNCEFLDPKTGT